MTTSPSEYIHPETGEVLASHEDWMRALAAVEEQMAPLYRLRRVLRDEAAERFQAAEMPTRRRHRTDAQEKVARCPRCGQRYKEEV